MEFLDVKRSNKKQQAVSEEIHCRVSVDSVDDKRRNLLDESHSLTSEVPFPKRRKMAEVGRCGALRHAKDLCKGTTHKQNPMVASLRQLAVSSFMTRRTKFLPFFLYFFYFFLPLQRFLLKNYCLFSCFPRLLKNY